jgi:hypothetical protein
MSIVDRRGAVHVHSADSDGGGSIGEILHAAQVTHLDFCVLTDDWRDGLVQSQWEGRHGSVLLIVGVELSPAGVPHSVALGADHAGDFDAMTAPEYLAAVRAQGGYCFAAHPRGCTRYGMSLRPWTDWDHRDLTGIEVWSYMHDWIESFSLLKGWSFYRHANDKITGPHPEVLAAWDRAASGRRLSGIAGLDVHARKYAFRRLEVFPYEMLFRTTLTHVLVEPSRGDDAADCRAVTGAMAAGRCYMAFHALGDPEGFRFRAETADREVEMGEEVALSASPVLKVTLPAEGEIRIVGGGEEVFAAKGREAEYRPQSAVPHRIEIRRCARPWVFSNHIYVK